MLPASIVLTHKRRARFQNLARFPSFRGADRRAPVKCRLPAIPFTAIEIQQNHLVAQIRVARDRAGAAAFRVAWVSARHHDLQSVRRRFPQQWQSGG